ncbi:MAG: mannose-1-phosphate guanylyltransferase [Anaerolineales bacterium]
MSFERTYPVIMAGGGGTRLWPLSRADRPKQSLPLQGGRSLFQLAIQRLQPAFSLDRILVVSVRTLVQQLIEQVPQLSEQNFLVEPSPRGTASVIGLAATVLIRRDPQAVMACLTADHLITQPDRFLQLLSAAEAVAQRGELVTLGITPTYPATGYGYIHVGESTGAVGGFPVSRVHQFKEKPDRSQAEQYLETGEYYWNSGMFVWTARRILEQIGQLMPELSAGLEQIAAALETQAEQQTLERVWGGLRSQTIDYGIMERAQGVSVIGADDLGWSDVGGWDRFSDLLVADPAGNLVFAEETLLVETQDTLFYQEKPDRSRRLIAALGLNDLIVVDTPDVLLVCRRERAEEVRRLVEMLTASGRVQYL